LWIRPDPNYVGKVENKMEERARDNRKNGNPEKRWKGSYKL